MCTLQNLTYQVWNESGEVEESCPAEVKSEGRRSPTVGCFSPRSRKAQKEVRINHNYHCGHILGPK